MPTFKPTSSILLTGAWFNKFPLLEKFPKFKAWLDASVNRPLAKEARKLRE
jgi:hypothetical protein